MLSLSSFTGRTPRVHTKYNTGHAAVQSKPAPINSSFDKMSQVSIVFDKSSPLRQARGGDGPAGRNRARGSGRSNAVLFSVYKIRPHAFSSCSSCQGWTAMVIILIIMCVAQRSAEGVAIDAGIQLVTNHSHANVISMRQE